MRYCLTLPTGGACADARVLAELGERAEGSGWDDVFLEDYVVFLGGPAAPTCDPWIALAAIAGRTRRIRLGTNVTPLARRRPRPSWMAEPRGLQTAGLPDRNPFKYLEIRSPRRIGSRDGPER